MDVLDSSRATPRRGPWLAFVAGVTVVVAIAMTVTLRRDTDSVIPTLPGWPAVGAHAGDERLRDVAWRGWSALDPSVRREQVAVLLAAEWTEAERHVVVLAMPYPHHVGVAVMVVHGDAAVRIRHLTMQRDRSYLVEHVQSDGHSAVVALAPTAALVQTTVAAVGATTSETRETRAPGGALVPVPAGRTATRAVLRDGTGKIVADRIPGSDLKTTPAVPLIVREEVDERGRRTQTRTDGEDVTCRVTLPAPDEEALTRVACPA